MKRENESTYDKNRTQTFTILIEKNSFKIREYFEFKKFIALQNEVLEKLVEIVDSDCNRFHECDIDNDSVIGYEEKDDPVLFKEFECNDLKELCKKIQSMALNEEYFKLIMYVPGKNIAFFLGLMKNDEKFYKRIKSILKEWKKNGNLD